MEPTARFGRRTAGQPSSPQGPPPGPRVAAWLKPDAPSQPAAPKIAPEIKRGVPWLTFGLVGLLTAIFYLEVDFALSPARDLTPGTTTWAALGAVSGNLVLHNGEWWRLITAAFLHGSPAHLIGNSITLIFVGAYLERLIGRAWLAAAFMIGAVAGSLFSMTLNAPDVVGVGASGAIMGLMGLAFVCTFHVEAHASRNRARWLVARVAIPALIPTHPAAGPAIDYSCHAGGAMAGVSLGFLLLAIWPENQPRPRFRTFALGVALAGVAVAALGVLDIAAQYPAHRARVAGYIPDRALPTTTDEQSAQSGALVAAYPKDPRAHLFRALYYLRNKDETDAQGELQTGLADPAAFNDSVPDTVQPIMQLTLAAVLADRGRVSEAKDTAGGACGYDFHGAEGVDKIRAYLKEKQVCP